MSDVFDPQMFRDPVYPQMLGMDSGELIKDCYALVGVKQFESDETEIEQAILRRFEQVRRYQVGKYEDYALQLIDALGRAYSCLTNDQEREAYNRTLEGGKPASAISERKPPTHVASAPDVAAKKPPVGGRTPKPTPSDGPPAEGNKGLCPQCGKITAPKAPVCYQCGFKKPAIKRAAPSPKKRQSGTGNSPFREFVRQDLTPEQLLARLREERLLIDAMKRASGLWKPPAVEKAYGRQRESSEASSRCRRCGKGLMRASDAYCLFVADVRRTVEFANTYGRKLQSLGRAQFEWPLSSIDVLRVQKMIPETDAGKLHMYCRGCAQRILRSPKVTS